MAGFDISPRAFISGAEQDTAVTALREYFACYTGSYFEQLADAESPSEFTARDIVAVTALSVRVPATVAIWLLSREGSARTRNLLEQIPCDSIASVPLEVVDDPSEPLSELWALLQSSGAQWPASTAKNKVGAVTAGKLIAAKRPALLPIYDKHVAAALTYPSGEGTYWVRWRAELHDTDLAALADAVRAKAAEGSGRDEEILQLSDLRTLDIAIWMRQHGYKASCVLKDDERFARPVPQPPSS